MTSQAVEKARTGGVALTGDQARWKHLALKASVYSHGTMVPKEMQSLDGVDRTDVVLVGMLTCLRLGFSEDAVTQLYVIEGRLDVPGQMMLGAVNMAGFDTRWVRTDNEAAVIAIGRPGDRAAGIDPLLIEFTIADARRAGLLDEWAEHWVPTGTGKSYKEKFVLGREGVDTPDWAKKEIRAGNTRHYDNWWKWTADMLASKAAKRAVRRMAPEVLFGIAADIRDAMGGQGQQFLDADFDVDGEEVTIVSEPPAPASGMTPQGQGAAPASGPAATTTNGDGEDGLDRPLTARERRTLHMLVDPLDPAHKARLYAAAKGRLPNIDGPHSTGRHVDLLLDLIEQTKAETGAKQGPPVADAGGKGSGEVPDPPAGNTDNLDPGREF